MATVKCYSCRGSKKLLSLGNIVKDCPTCSGVGYLKSDDSQPLQPVKPFNPTQHSDTIIKIKQKPGRKPRAIVDILQV